MALQIALGRAAQAQRAVQMALVRGAARTVLGRADERYAVTLSGRRLSALEEAGSAALAAWFLPALGRKGARYAVTP